MKDLFLFKRAVCISMRYVVSKRKKLLSLKSAEEN